MSTLIEDSPRTNLASWIIEAHAAKTAVGAVITPWASPYVHQGGAGPKPGIRERVEEFRRAGVSYWFDPTTHALQMPGVGDWRYYQQFSLWGGPVGDLTTDALRREHIRRVFRLQDEIGAPHLAPTPLLQSGLSNMTKLALDTARAALEIDATSRLAIAGTSTFWSDGADLDAHIGALAALQPSGWFVSFVQPDNDLPPSLTSDEVHGVARTVRALSEYAPIHVSHGDFAALPAIAAGAETVGTGWDKRQRVVAYSDYSPRPVPQPGETPMGAWYTRPSFLGLLGSLENRDGELLGRQDPTLAAALGGLPGAPGAKAAYLHHVEQLDTVVRGIQAAGDNESRYRALDAEYTAASRNWAAVHASTGIRDQSDKWISPLQQGLRMYARDEGWI